MSVSSDSSNQRTATFTLYQARLRAEEIDFLANEDFRSNLQKLVEQSTSKLTSDFEIQSNEIERNSKIAYSMTQNNQRISVLDAQRSILDRASKKASEKLKEIHDSPKYKDILTALIYQGLMTLNEPDLAIRVTSADAPIVEECLAAAIQKIGTNTKITASVDKENSLDESKIGGAIIFNKIETIRCDNSFAGRLLLSIEGSLPNICALLHQ